MKLRLLLVLSALAIGLVAAPLSASPPQDRPDQDVERLGQHDCHRLRRAPRAGRRPELEHRSGLLGRHGRPGLVHGVPSDRRHVPLASEGDRRGERLRAELVRRQPGRRGDLRKHPQPVVELEHAGIGVVVRRQRRSARVRGPAHLRHLEQEEPDHRRFGRPRVRLAHADDGPRPRQQPAARLRRAARAARAATSTSSRSRSPTRPARDCSARSRPRTIHVTTSGSSSARP